MDHADTCFAISVAYVTVANFTASHKNNALEYIQPVGKVNASFEFQSVSVNFDHLHNELGLAAKPLSSRVVFYYLVTETTLSKFISI
jgi:hypothetical protein